MAKSVFELLKDEFKYQIKYKFRNEHLKTHVHMVILKMVFLHPQSDTCGP